MGCFQQILQGVAERDTLNLTHFANRITLEDDESLGYYAGLV